MFSRVLACIVGCLMQFSLCTGGAFAVASAVIHRVTDESPQRMTYESEPMSYGAVGYLSCVSNKKHDNPVTSGTQKGCNNTSSCLSREFATKRDLLQFASSWTPTVPTSPLSAVRPSYPEHFSDDTFYNHYSIALVHPGLSSVVKVE